MADALCRNKAYTDLIGDDMVWLSIKRKDKDCRDWRDFMTKIN